MTPSQISSELRRIAAKIDASRQPSLSLVMAALKRLADEFEPEYQEDVRRIMEKGLPPLESKSSIIKSNYPLENADIFFSTSVKFYDMNDRPMELPDTIETQQQLIKKPHRKLALIIWGDIDILAEYDPDGQSDTSSSHGEDVSPDELGIRDVSSLMAAAGPGSLVTNAEFKNLAEKHGYNTKFMLDYE